MDGGKTCFKCGETKPLYQFYPHKKMGDGHLNKCKECAKADAKRQYFKSLLDPLWLARERERNRNRMSLKRIMGGRQKSSPSAHRRWAQANRHKMKAQWTARNAVRDGRLERKYACERCDATGVKLHMHHHDYSKPLDVVWLCRTCHGREHWKPLPKAA